MSYANAGNKLLCSIEYSMWFILFLVNLMTLSICDAVKYMILGLLVSGEFERT
jgi:hypothetical protein